MEKMDRQWTERQLGFEQVTVSASVRLTADAGRVWEFLLTPESAYLADPSVVKAFRVPGTPAGEVGDQHCFIRDEGEGRLSMSLMELVEMERPLRMTARWPTYPATCTSTYDLRADGTAVALSWTVEVLVERGQRRRLKPTLQAELQSQLDRLAAGIRSGLTLPEAEGA